MEIRRQNNHRTTEKFTVLTRKKCRSKKKNRQCLSLYLFSSTTLTEPWLRTGFKPIQLYSFYLSSFENFILSNRRRNFNWPHFWKSPLTIQYSFLRNFILYWEWRFIHFSISKLTNTSWLCIKYFSADNTVVDKTDVFGLSFSTE